MTKAYIKKKKYIFPFNNHKNDETLVIKESCIISGETHKRTNKFIKNENGEWVLHILNGIQSCGFVDVSHNPWNIERRL